MSLFRRGFFFILVNIAVIATISIVINLLGIRPYLSQNGIDYTSLLVFCSIWDFGGAFISLFLSKWIAKKSMGVHLISPTQANGYEKKLLDMVYKIAAMNGMRKMPEVGVYESPEVNAFATGASKNSSLVAVSTGLLNKMDEKEVEGVLAHEVAHIVNGDMVTMTLLQGVINSFVMFLSRAIAFGISRGDDDERSPFLEFGLVIVLDILFSILGSVVLNFFSRWREYRADAGAARSVGKDKMIAALKRLQNNVDLVDQRDKAFASMKISGGRPSLAALFSTHPSLEDRIKRLEMGLR